MANCVAIFVDKNQKRIDEIEICPRVWLIGALSFRKSFRDAVPFSDTKAVRIAAIAKNDDSTVRSLIIIIDDDRWLIIDDNNHGDALILSCAVVFFVVARGTSWGFWVAGFLLKAAKPWRIWIISCSTSALRKHAEYLKSLSQFSSLRWGWKARKS